PDQAIVFNLAVASGHAGISFRYASCHWGHTRSPLQQPGADEQRAQRIGRLHGQHRIAGGALQRTHGIGMQRAKLDPFDRAEIGDEPVGLADGPDRYRPAVQLDLENRPQRGVAISSGARDRGHEGDGERRDAVRPSLRLGTTTRRLTSPLVYAARNLSY